MNITTADKPATESDCKIISRIIAMIKDGLEKLKSFVKVKKESKFKIYYELEEKFNEIALRLEKFEFLNTELDYFLMIAEKILYIIYQNCKNPSFGHCEFALEIFDFFIEIVDEKIRLIDSSSNLTLTNYENSHNEFKRRYFEYNKIFNMEIYVESDDNSKEKFYRIMETMRG